MNELSVHDTVLSVFAILSEKENFKEIDRQKIHNVFYSSKNKYSLLNDMFFDTNGHTPYSEGLEDIFSTCVLSGLIDSPRPPAKYRLNEALNGFYKNIKEKHPEQIEELENLADDFYKLYLKN